MHDWKVEIRARLNRSPLDGSSEAELVEELAQHAEERYRDLSGRGQAMTTPIARC